MSQELLSVLEKIIKECEGPGKPESSDSWLPACLIDEAKTAIASANESDFVESIRRNALESFTALQNIAFCQIEDADEFTEFVLRQANDAVARVMQLELPLSKGEL